MSVDPSNRSAGEILEVVAIARAGTKQITKQAAKPTAKPATKPAAKHVAKPTAKQMAKPTAKPGLKPTAKLGSKGVAKFPNEVKVPVRTENAPKQPRVTLSVQSQKTFIIENANILNKETKVAILSVVMMEVGEDAVMQRLGAKNVEINEVDIDLDICSAGETGDDIICQIYNIVKARIDALNQPAGADNTSHRSADAIPPTKKAADSRMPAENRQSEKSKLIVTRATKAKSSTPRKSKSG